MHIKRPAYHQLFVTTVAIPACNDLRLLFFKQRSISSLFKTPVGEETSVFAAISREHIGDSAGLTVADKSCMINTHTRRRWLLVVVDYCWGYNRRLGER